MAQLYRTLTGQSNKSTTSASTAPLAKTTTTGANTVSGRLNHLTESQEEQLGLFKEKLQEGGWWTPDGINGKPSHDDGTLLRYLRARKFVVDDAMGQFTDTEKWMKENKVEDLYDHFDVDFYERARKMYPQWTGRRDKRGIPIYVYEIKGLDSKNVTKYQKESESYKTTLPDHKKLKTSAKMLPLFALYHNLLNFVLPLCSTLDRPHPEIPVTNSTNIVDIQGVGLGQFWNLKQHMQEASVLATAHYPETLDRIFIIGAPAFFPTVWGWIKRWFDPVTVSKIFILSKNEVKPTLESFMDPQDFPKKYGGTLDWAWGDLPDPGPAERAALEADGSKGWIAGPCLWLDGKRVPVGIAHGKTRRDDKEVAALKPVVYAADETEVPVHPDRKASVVSSKAGATNGKATEPSIQSPKDGAAVVTSSPTTTSPTQPAAATAVAATPVQTPSDANVKLSPMGDSRVHLLEAQPASPAHTAEYISPVTTTTTTEQPPAADTTPVSAAPVPSTTSVQQAPPPGHVQPGALSDHQVEVAKVIAQKLEGESTSVIPASSGGENGLAHPEVIVSSDPSKGLAAEADKLQLGGEQNNRPGLDRFVTAQDVKP